jgi:hypothetical protein
MLRKLSGESLVRHKCLREVAGAVLSSALRRRFNGAISVLVFLEPGLFTMGGGDLLLDLYLYYQPQTSLRVNARRQPRQGSAPVRGSIVTE